MNGHFGPQAPIDLVTVGTVPGILDSSQRDRILREPNATLHFASFDPLTAGGTGATLNFARMSLDEDYYRPKRIVVEVGRSGQFTWRFVPAAKLAEGVIDEGFWPRIIDICGEFVHCSREQWEIYKLDPFYECTVKKFPAVSTVRPVSVWPPPPPPSPGRKRRHETVDDSTPGPAPKKVHYDCSITMKSVSDLSDNTYLEEDEVEEMITDDTYYQRRSTPVPGSVAGKRHKPHFSTSTLYPHAAASRTPRRKPVPTAPYSKTRPDPSSHLPRNRSIPPESSSSPHKRKVREQSQRAGDEPTIPMSDVDDDDHVQGPSRKRPNFGPEPERIPSPTTQRQRYASRREKEERKRKRWEAELQAKINARDQRLMDEIMADVPQGSATPQDDPPARAQSEVPFDPSSQDDSTPSADSQEAERLAAIEESRRKLAELEADRPLWDAASKERRSREQAEEEQRRVKAEARQRVQSERLKAEREKKRQQEEEKAERLRREEREKEEVQAKLDMERQARRNRWTSGRWTHARAIERFVANSDYFEVTRFSVDKIPLYSEDVPWPTLLRPSAFSLEDVDWASVEHFFEVLKTHLKATEYISVVEKSHRRFHPDRWRSRNLFKAVLDPAERNCMEVAATTVSQAITPIWQRVRSMKQA